MHKENIMEADVTRQAMGDIIPVAMAHRIEVAITGTPQVITVTVCIKRTGGAGSNNCIRQ